MRFEIKPGGRLVGECRVPGDKSISHRSIMLGSIASGVSHVTGFLQGADALATLNGFRAMGAEIEQHHNGEITVHGVGLHGLQQPSAALDLGNSGTSMRLMAGLLAGQAFETTLFGDESLSGRPMNRVAIPLRDMGANIEAAEGGRPPLHIKPSSGLRGIEYRLPVASAQIKSSLLLAGLYADGNTTIIEPAPTRDHTERMLRTLGYEVDAEPGGRVSLWGGGKLEGGDIRVPADISSAAFFLVAASIVPGSELVLKDVGVNETRTGIIDILKAMGANIEVSNRRDWGAEPVADLTVRASKLRGIAIPEELVPLAIDEFPVVFIAASAAEGETVLTGAKELRVKESDRISVMADGINALGGRAQPTDDGMIVQGATLQGGTVHSHGDHRIAMSFSVAGMLASGPVQIENCANVGTSFPGFAELAARLGMNISAR